MSLSDSLSSPAMIITIVETPSPTSSLWSLAASARVLTAGYWTSSSFSISTESFVTLMMRSGPLLNVTIL